MKKFNHILAIWLTMTFLIFSARIGWAANSIALTTYYPAPQGIYDRLSLIPQSTLPSPCTVATIMVEQASGKILYCHNVAGTGTWGLLSNVWLQSGNYIYPAATDTNTLIYSAIGTINPLFKLTLDNDGGILASGTFGSGIITAYPSTAVNQSAPANGRLIWYPRKAAFRAIWDRWGVTDDTLMGNYSVAFGDTPTASATGSTVSGRFNSASGSYATIAGGMNNSAAGNYSTITGGQTNLAPSLYSVVSGASNQANGDYNTISGGQNNTSLGTGETISGGLNNTITVNSSYSTIAGGELNSVQGKNFATINGGYQNTASGDYSTIGGGKANTASGNYSFVGGGDTNTASGVASVVGGGKNNVAAGDYSAIIGGTNNSISASGTKSSILGGDQNQISGSFSAITASTSSTISGNYSIITAGNHASVAADYSWASGENMNLTAAATRTFLWGYSSSALNVATPNAFILAPGNNPFYSKLGINESAPSGILSITLPSGSPKDFLAITTTDVANPGDVFIVKNNGYVGIGKYNPSYPLQIGTNATNGNGAYLTVGGVWTNTSSRKFKDDIQPLHPQKAIATLQKLTPITYNYKTDKTDRHVGFIAEDVPDLIAEKGHKGLNAMPVTAVLTAVLKEQKKSIAQQEAILNDLENQLQDLKERLPKR